MASGGGAALTLVTERVDVEAVEAGLQTGNSAIHVRLAVGLLDKVEDARDIVLLFRVSEDTLGLQSCGRSVMGLGLRLVVALLLVRVRGAVTCGGMGWLVRCVGGRGSRMTVWQLGGVRRTTISTLRRAILLGFCSDLSISGERTSGKEGKNGGKSLHVDLLYDLYDL